MKTFLLGLCSFLLVGGMFLLFNRMLKQSRQKTSLYTHKSELEDTPISFAMDPQKNMEQKADVAWEDEIDK